MRNNLILISSILVVLVTLSFIQENSVSKTTKSDTLTKKETKEPKVKTYSKDTISNAFPEFHKLKVAKHQLVTPTVAELISELQKYEQNEKVVLYQTNEDYREIIRVLRINSITHRAKDHRVSENHIAIEGHTIFQED